MSNTREYRVELLDVNEGLVRVLNTEAGGSLTYDANKQIRSGGKINVVAPARSIDWLHSYIRIWHIDTAGEGRSMGIFLPTATTEQNLATRTSYPVELHDKVKILADDKVNKTYTVAADTVVTNVIRDLIVNAGQSRMNITASTKTMGKTMYWKAGTPRITIINELLDYLNYFALWVDGNGVFQAIPYRTPQKRPVVRSFERGVDAIHMPDWTREQDDANVPNEMILTIPGDGDEEGLVGVYRNMNVASPYSIPNRGRVISAVEDDKEAPDLATANALAERRLISLSSPSATITLEHMVVPLSVNDVVRFRSGHVDTLAVVEKMTIKMTASSLCKSTWREVVPV